MENEPDEIETSDCRTSSDAVKVIEIKILQNSQRRRGSLSRAGHEKNRLSTFLEGSSEPELGLNFSVEYIRSGSSGINMIHTFKRKRNQEC